MVSVCVCVCVCTWASSSSQLILFQDSDLLWTSIGKCFFMSNFQKAYIMHVYCILYENTQCNPKNIPCVASKYLSEILFDYNLFLI